MPNLLGAAVLKPEHVELLTSEQADAVGERLADWLRRHGCRVGIRRIDPYDTEDVRRACGEILDAAPSIPVVLNATGGTKIAALAAITEVQRRPTTEIFYVNTDRGSIHWLAPAEHPPRPLEVRLTIEDCMAVHGLRVDERAAPSDPQRHRLLGARIARLAARAEPLLNYFHRVFHLVDRENVILARAVAIAQEERFPADLGPAQRELLQALIDEGMVAMKGEVVDGIRSTEDLRYLGGGGWLEEHCYVTVRDAHVFDEVAANLVVSWGEGVTNELDVVAVRRGRLFFFECKTGGAVSRRRKDEIGQDAVFKLDRLRDLAGGTFARAILIGGSKMTPLVKQRCKRLGVKYVDVDNLHRLAEIVRRVAGA